MNISARYQKHFANKAKNLDIKFIRRDGGTQPRAGIDDQVVADYAEDIAEGVTFPAVTVYYDGEAYWLADGFHRVDAHLQAGKTKIAVDIRQGRRRDAILHSVGANATHGLQRSRADKRRAVETLLADQEWSQWSDREIARRCNVSADLVGDIRSLLTVGNDSERTYVTKHGTTATMDTSAIGKSPSIPVATVSAEVAEVADTTQAHAPEQDTPEVDHSAFHEAARSNLPQSIKDHEAAKAEWREKARTEAGSETFSGLLPEDRIAELEEAVRALEAEAEALRTENRLYGEMRVQFAQGGFDKVVAGKDEEIRVLETRLYRESADKAKWASSSKWWQEQALKLGWSSDEIIPLYEPQDGGQSDE